MILFIVEVILLMFSHLRKNYLMEKYIKLYILKILPLRIQIFLLFQIITIFFWVIIEIAQKTVDI